MSADRLNGEREQTAVTLVYKSPGFIADAWRVARKDLLIEFRTRSAFLAACVFALLSVAIFRFTWDGTAIPAMDLAPPVLWVIFTFSGLLGLNRSFQIEQADRALDALLASPMSRESVFAGKVIANFVFVLSVQALALPGIALFFDLPSGGGWFGVMLIVVLAAIGLSAVGTLFAAVASNTRMAEMLLPMLALPFFVPLVIPAAQASVVLLEGRPMADAANWLKILLAFDIVFTAACTVAFPYTLEE